MATRIGKHTLVVGVGCWLFTPLILANAGAGATLHDRFESQSAGQNRTYIWQGAYSRAVLDSGGRVRFDTFGATGRKTVRFEFRGARLHSQPEGDGTCGITRYYQEPRRRGALERPCYRRVRYRNLYPGVDLVFYSDRGALEYNLELAPNARPDLIRISHGNLPVRVNAQGDLEVGAEAAILTERQPHVYQIRDSEKVAVACRYVVHRNGVAGFDLSGYDREQALIIDPVMNFATDIGGDGFEAAYAVATDSAGYVYLAGETDSISFFTAGRRSNRDAYVAKLAPSGAGIVYITYMGGSGADSARGLALDSAGNAYVTGATSSLDFPRSPAVGVANAGYRDVFAVKLNASGSIVYATTFGSTGADEANAIAVDVFGNAYVAGQTTSPGFPTTSTAFQRTYKGGAADCFVSKLNTSGTSLLYSTFLGGSGLDLCRGIAVDSGGNAYVAGTTYSTDFSVQSPVQSALGGSGDAFVAKLNSVGTALTYATFLGGDSLDEANAIAVDASGSAYVAGHTVSSNFPVTFGILQNARNGDYDAFAVKLSPTGGALTYSTLFGGSSADSATSIAVDAQGKAAIAGFTTSANLPVRAAVQTAAKGSFDGFVAVLDAFGSQLLFSSYFGGSGEDRAYALAMSSGRHIYLAGVTQSADLPGFVAGPRIAGNYDAFIAELTYDDVVTNGNFFAMTPCRIVDTRWTTYGVQFGFPYITGGTVRTFPLPSSPCGIPSTASGYSLNITALPRKSMLQYLTIWPAGQHQPAVSTLNAFDGRVVANAAIVPAGAGGGLSVYMTEDSDLLIDINGYFSDSAPSAGLAFYTLRPCTVVDTRSTSTGGPYLGGNTIRVFPVLQTSCGAPASAQTYLLNFTALPMRSMLQYVSVWPAGQAYPSVSTLNSFNGAPVANAALVGSGSSGAMNVLVSEDTNLITDITGYFAPSGGANALSFHALPPCRIADTRLPGPGAMAANTTRRFDVLSTSCNVPAAARAYSFNVTVVPSKPLQYLTIWASGDAMPAQSTVLARRGEIVANATIVPAGLNGAVDVYVTDSTHVIIDINGYFAP